MNNSISSTQTPTFHAIEWVGENNAKDHGIHQTFNEAWQALRHLYPVSARVQVWGTDYSEISMIVNGEAVETFYFADPTLDEDSDAYVGFDLTTPILEQIQHLNPIK